VADTSLLFSTIAELGRLLRARKVSSVELTRLALEALETRGRALNAVAELAPELRFILGGEGWGDYSFPPNVRYIGHVPTALHTTVNSSADFVLNINRLAMVSYGYSPPTRVFEAAGCAACLITDYWQGIEQFLEPDREVLVIRDACELVDVLRNVSPERAEEIGKNAYRRVISDHTYQARAKQLDKVIKQMHKCETQAV
jgi:spore maturation protein CgeB